MKNTVSVRHPAGNPSTSAKQAPIASNVVPFTRRAPSEWAQRTTAEDIKHDARRACEISTEALRQAQASKKDADIDRADAALWDAWAELDMVIADAREASPCNGFVAYTMAVAAHLGALLLENEIALKLLPKGNKSATLIDLAACRKAAEVAVRKGTRAASAKAVSK